MISRYFLIRNSFLLIFFFLISAGAQAQSNNAGKIQIDNFRVSEIQNKINIGWSTNSGQATNYFEVQKSVDGKNFRTIAYVFGADPAKPGCECFGCFDKKDSKRQISYYRLKHRDLDGHVQFSEIKMLALK
jgi:hypothetical protein